MSSHRKYLMLVASFFSSSASFKV